MNAQVMQVYLFILTVLNSIGTGAQAVVVAFQALMTAVANRDLGQIADALKSLTDAISAIVDKFQATAHPHFTAHSALQPHEMEARCVDAEQKFHGIFGGGGGAGAGAGGGTTGSGLNLGGILQFIKGNLPLILSILKLFGVNVPISLPTS